MAQNIPKRKILLPNAKIILIIVQGVLQNKFIKNTARQDTTLLMMLICILKSSLFYVQFCQNKILNIANFLSGLIQYEKMYPCKPRKFVKLPPQEEACVVMVKAAFFSGLRIPIGIAFCFLLENSWKSSMARYWLIPDTKDQGSGAPYEFVQIIFEF